MACFSRERNLKGGLIGDMLASESIPKFRKIIQGGFTPKISRSIFCQAEVPASGSL